MSSARLRGCCCCSRCCGRTESSQRSREHPRGKRVLAEVRSRAYERKQRDRSAWWIRVQDLPQLTAHALNPRTLHQRGQLHPNRPLSSWVRSSSLASYSR